MKSPFVRFSEGLGWLFCVVVPALAGVAGGVLLLLGIFFHPVTPTSAEVAGLYELKHSTGKIELWELCGDGKLRQTFYASEAMRAAGTILLEFESVWTPAPNSVRFERSCSFIDFGNWQVQEEAEESVSGSAAWLPPRAGQPAMMDFIDGAGFVAARVGP